MTSILANIVKPVVGASGNVHPDIINKKNLDTVEVLRSIDKMFTNYRPPMGYTVDKFTLDGLPCEFFHKKGVHNKKVIYALHGGAYTSRLAFIYRWKNKPYSKIAGGASVLNIDYRVQPEFLFPSALEDALKGWEWLLSEGYVEDDIALIGDSAGGHLVLNLLMKLRERGHKLPKAAVLFSPWLDMTGTGDSYLQNFRRDPIFGWKKPNPTQEDVEKLINCPMYGFVGNNDRRDPYISPVFADCTGFCPIHTAVGGDEMLLSDATTLAQNLKKAGVESSLDIRDGLFHGFSLYPIIPESRKSFAKAMAFLNRKMED